MTGSLAAPVEEIRATAYEVPTDDQPEQDATLTWSHTTVVVVEARSGADAGIGWTYSSRGAAAVVDDVIGPAVLGVRVADVARANQGAQMAIRNLGTGGIAAHAVSAVDLALWDLKARVIGCSLAELVGPVRDRVPVYGSGGFTSLSDDRLAEQARAWAAHGMGQAKIKVARHPERDLERLQIVRDAVGDHVALYVDANGGYGRAEAVAWAERFANRGVTWLEEPLTSEDLDGLRMLRACVPPGLAVAAGEYVDHLTRARELLEAQAVDVLQLDVTRCGGITGFLAAAALARAHHVDVSAHCAPHAHIAVAAACPNLRHVEWFHDHVRIEALLFAGGTEVRGGTVDVDRATAGNGLAVRSDAERFRVHAVERPAGDRGADPDDQTPARCRADRARR